ncbi:uncharacterized protein LOC129223953 [Uloborus diversus]|uniref:uncharacterized protein LOC129223953 n=1 Tax=Uloborus diversus TaxID=327109 RepID=UPI00240A6D39|nr:uncharacterized protein LOC129223953 [Uloborus diversus]
MNYRHRRNNVNARLKLYAKRKKNSGKNLAIWREKKKQNCQSNNPEGDIGISSEKKNEDLMNGRRIVDIRFFIKSLQELNAHSSLGCTFSDMDIVSEKRCGLRSGIKFKCKMCNFTKLVWTEKSPHDKMSINAAAVTGVIAIGAGHSNLEEFLSVIEIPTISINTFLKEYDIISKAWESTALKEMELAGIEEKEIAIRDGKVDADEVPCITVIADGSWAKRSYRSNYSSLSGVVS